MVSHPPFLTFEVLLVPFSRRLVISTGLQSTTSRIGGLKILASRLSASYRLQPMPGSQLSWTQTRTVGVTWTSLWIHLSAGRVIPPRVHRFEISEYIP